MFVSSTWLDLQPKREAVEKALQRMRETKLIGMEYFGSRDNTTRQVSLDEVDRSHFYIGIFGARYGSGITEAEYRRAREKDIPCRVYFKSDTTITNAQRETDPAKVAKLAALKAELKLDHTVPQFTSPDDLAAIITADFHNWLVETKHAERGEFDQLHTLPPRPIGSVGREADLAKLRALNPSAGAHLTGLRGTGGIGKTALALVLAHEWAARFPDAQLFLDARGTQADPPSAWTLMERVVLAFHPTAKLPDDDSAISAIYRDVLTGKRALILLDNARDAAQAKPLIPPAGCALIVTSRQAFMLGTVKPHDVGRLPDADASALLREYHAALTDAEAAERPDGRPDVAACVKLLCGGRLAHLDADADDAGEVTISETLRQSEERLSTGMRDTWRALGVFTASSDARAAEAVALADGHMLDVLVRRSLLEREGAERFKVHDLAADYARAQLDDDALTGLHLAHARHYTEVAEVAQKAYMNGDAAAGLALFDIERVQIELAYTWLSFRDDEHASRQLPRLVDAVVYTGQALRFLPRQRIVLSDGQLGAARRVKNQTMEGYALTNLGLAHDALGDMRKAMEYHKQRLGGCGCFLEKIGALLDERAANTAG